MVSYCEEWHYAGSIWFRRILPDNTATYRGDVMVASYEKPNFEMRSPILVCRFVAIALVKLYFPQRSYHNVRSFLFSKTSILVLRGHKIDLLNLVSENKNGLLPSFPKAKTRLKNRVTRLWFTCDTCPKLKSVYYRRRLCLVLGSRHQSTTKGVTHVRMAKKEYY